MIERLLNFKYNSSLPQSKITKIVRKNSYILQINNTDFTLINPMKWKELKKNRYHEIVNLSRMKAKFNSKTRLELIISQDLFESQRIYLKPILTSNQRTIWSILTILIIINAKKS